MGDGYTAISDSMFGANMVSDVVEAIVPSCITYIGEYAFNSDYRTLNKLTVYATEPPMLYDTRYTCPIYVPSESVETYKTASYWSTYADRIQAIS